MPLLVEERNNDTSGPGGPVPSPSLDFNDNEDLPTELSDSSETHDEGKCTEQNEPSLFSQIRNLMESQFFFFDSTTHTRDDVEDTSHEINLSSCLFVERVGEVQAFHEDLNGRQHINEVYKFSVDKLYDILFTESQFMSDFMEQRRFSGQYPRCFHS